jgi:hypothetical protein
MTPNCISSDLFLRDAPRGEVPARAVGVYLRGIHLTATRGTYGQHFSLTGRSGQAGFEISFSQVQACLCG